MPAVAASGTLAYYDFTETAYRFANRKLLSIPAPETPTLDVARMNAENGDGLRIDWQCLRNYQVSTALSSDAGTGTSITISSTAGEAFQVGDVIMAQNASESDVELILITLIAGADLTVTRRYGQSGTPLDLNANDLLTRVYSTVKEAASVYPFGTVNLVNLFNLNYYQRFARREQLTRDVLDIKVFENPALQAVVSSLSTKLLWDIEGGISIGGSPSSTPQGSSTVAQTMKGFHQIFKDFNTGNDGTGLADTVGAFNNFLEIAYNRSRQNNLLILGRSAIKNLWAFYDYGFTYNCDCHANGAAKRPSSMGVVNTPFGKYHFIVNSWIPRLAVYAMNMGDIRLVVKRQIEMRYSAPGDVGPVITVEGEYSLRCGDPSLWAYGLADNP